MPFKSNMVEIMVDGELVKAKKCTVCEEVKIASENFKMVNKEKRYYESRCIDCNQKYKKAWRRETSENHKMIKRKWQEDNKEKYKIMVANGNQLRRARKRSLNDSLTFDQWKSTLEDFNNCCALSKSENVVMEHFIPLSWGHGGTYIGNVYPLDKLLNISKKDLNPFKWAAENEIDIEAWNQLVNYLAKLNNLSNEDFIGYVNWCEINKKSKED
jgi:hypothetical protein